MFSGLICKILTLFSLCLEVYPVKNPISRSFDVCLDACEHHNGCTVWWQVSANFPEQQEKIGELLQKVSALQDVRLRLGAEVADHSGLIRSLVVRAEDARHLDDM
jgi:hypothetical protein